MRIVSVKPRLEAAFLGRAGMDGPLPPPVAALVRERARGKPGLSRFSRPFPKPSAARPAGSGPFRLGPDARLGDPTADGGTIVSGCPTVLVGGWAFSRIAG